MQYDSEICAMTLMSVLKNLGLLCIQKEIADISVPVPLSISFSFLMSLYIFD